MDMEHVHFETGGTIAAVDFLFGSLCGLRGCDWVRKEEEDYILR